MTQTSSNTMFGHMMTVANEIIFIGGGFGYDRDGNANPNLGYLMENVRTDGRLVFSNSLFEIPSNGLTPAGYSIIDMGSPQICYVENANRVMGDNRTYDSWDPASTVISRWWPVACP